MFFLYFQTNKAIAKNGDRGKNDKSKAIATRGCSKKFSASIISWEIN